MRINIGVSRSTCIKAVHQFWSKEPREKSSYNNKNHTTRPNPTWRSDVRRYRCSVLLLFVREAIYETLDVAERTAFTGLLLAETVIDNNLLSRQN